MVLRSYQLRVGKESRFQRAGREDTYAEEAADGRRSNSLVLASCLANAYYGIVVLRKRQSLS